MSTNVLVLNSNYQAISVFDWQRAISLLFQGAAEVVGDDAQMFDFEDWAELSKMMHEHPNGFVRSEYLKIAIPEVIRLTRYDRIPRNQVVLSRRNILERDSYRCGYCGKKFKSSELNLDHIIPKCKGGKTTWENVISSCFPCNSKKDCMDLKTSGMKLLVKPVKPNHQPIFKRLVLSLPKNTRDSWGPWINRAYWNSPLEE